MDRQPTGYGPADQADIARKAAKEDTIIPPPIILSAEVQLKLVRLGFTRGDWNQRIMEALSCLGGDPYDR